MKTAPEKAYERLGAALNFAGDCRGAYLAFHERQKEKFLSMPASVNSHHAFVGGYAVHICEVVANIYWLVEKGKFGPGKRPAIHEAVIAAYIHDLDKLLMRYELDDEKPTEAQAKFANSLGIRCSEFETKTTISKKIDARKNHQPDPLESELPVHRYRKDARNMDDAAAVLFLCGQYGLGGITEDIVHAVSLHHGGWAPLARSNDKLRMSPLAIILHNADQQSAVCQNGEEE